MYRRFIVAVALLWVGLVTACQSPTSIGNTPTPPSPLPSPVPSPTPTAAPSPTPTPVPPKEFTVCQAEEPNTLFIYGGPSRAARNVLEAIYDGPIDTQTYQSQPVILEKLPSLADGDAELRTVEVTEGASVVDVEGLVVDLAPGVTVLRADGQEVTFEGEIITMTQMAATFRLRPDVTWADGQPLTASDSRYSFELAGEFESPALQWLRDRTFNYEVVDDHTVVWIGVPGYRDLFYFQNFYHPLPRHAFGGVDAERLLSAEVAHRKPMGWGPFVVEEWWEGEAITLVRNPHYFRASEGLPYLDRVTFRFVSDLREALDLVGAGECDLITRDVIEGGDLGLLLEAATAGTVRLVSSPSSEWEHLDFGIETVSWAHRPALFGDVRVRQAVARCIDRERIAGEAFPYGKATVAQSYVAPDHPLYTSEQLYRWDYDLANGQSLLGEIGWRDEDGDGIREAHNVPGIVNRTPFSVTLLMTSDQPARDQTARILSENLAACGIGMVLGVLPAEDFFADGPDGPVFGRQFDLALFSWLNGLGAPCELYLSTEIPGPENWWATSNNPGYANEDYDAACQAALGALPGTEEYIRFHRDAQRIFSHDLPVLPLYFVPKLVATRPGVSGVVLNPSEHVDLWNIEAFDFSR
jgi:peptide/nickel transport system substrate-binding protein